MTMPGSGYSFSRLSYPDPFFDQASARLPKSQQKLFELCHIFATTHPQIKPIVHKLAKYPITNVVVTSDDNQSSLEDKWEELLEKKLNIINTTVQVGLDYWGYGNAFVVLERPFIRVYECNTCQHQNTTQDIQYYILNKKFHGKCTSCKRVSQLTPKDLPTSNVEDISIAHIPPQEMRIVTNRVVGRSEYFRQPPQDLANAIKDGKKPTRFIIDTTPLPYIEAVLQKKLIKYGKNKILHLKEPGLSSADAAWGSPVILAGLKDAYLNQVLKKSDEAISHERTVPRRFIFPDARSSDPMSTIGLSKWASYMRRMIDISRQDPNAVMPVPFPVGVTELGGQTQSLVTPQIRDLLIREIVASTGVPEAFWSGDMTYSGGSVQGRLFENMIRSYTTQLNRLLEYIVSHCSKILDWPKVDVRWQEFKKADDVQVLSLLMNLMAEKHVSAKEILERLDINWAEQHDIIKEETKKVQQIRVEEALLETKTMLAGVEYQAITQGAQEGVSNIINQINQGAQQDGSQLSAHKPFTDDDRLAIQLMSMSYKDREAYLREMGDKKQATELRKRLTQMRGGGSILPTLLDSADSPDELAKRIFMLPQEMRTVAILELQKSNPALAVSVSRSLKNAMMSNTGAANARSAPGIPRVDARPLPQQKPPRRK